MILVTSIIFCSGKEGCTNSTQSIEEVSPKIKYICKECLPKVPRKHRGDETQFCKDVARPVSEMLDEFGRYGGSRAKYARSSNMADDNYDAGANVNQER